MASRVIRSRLDPEVRRELILDAAERVMAGRVPAEVTFEEIADAAEVSRGLVHNYFKDRTGLLVALAERATDRLDREVLGSLDPGASLAEQVESLGRAYSRYARANAGTWKTLSRSGLLDHPAVQGSRADRVARLAELWGGTGDAHLAAWAVTGLYEMTGFTSLPPDIEGRDLTRFLRDLVGPALVAQGVGPVVATPG